MYNVFKKAHKHVGHLLCKIFTQYVTHAPEDGLVLEALALCISHMRDHCRRIQLLQHLHTVAQRKHVLLHRVATTHTCMCVCVRARLCVCM